MNFFALSGFLTGITSSVLALVVYFKAPKHMPNRLWVLFSLAVAMWGFGSYRIAMTTQPASALLWWKLTHIGIIAIPPLFLHFMCLFLTIERTRMISAAYALAGVFLAADLGTDWLIKDMRFVFDTFYYDSPPGPLYIPFVLFFFSTIFYGHVEMFQAYRHATGQKKDQLRYFFLATACGFVGGSTSFLPVFGIDIYPLLNFTVPLYPIIMSYAIVRYRLMDISVILNRSLAYALLLTAIFLAASFGALLSTRATASTVPPLLTAALAVWCGLLVFFSNRRSESNITLACFCGAIAIWLFGTFMLISASTRTEALQWGRAVNIGTIYVPALFFHFCMRVIGQQTATARIRLLYAISTGFLLLAPTPWLITTPYRYAWGYYPSAGLLHPLFLVYFITTAAVGLARLFQAYRITLQYDSVESARLKYSFWTFCVGFTATVDFLPCYGFDLYPVGTLIAGLWMVMVIYTIVQHRLVDVTIPRWDTHRPLYTQSLGMLGALFTIVLTIRLFSQEWDFTLTGVLLALFLLFAGFLASLPRTIEGLLGRQLLRARYNAYETLVRFSQSLVSILELQSLAKEIAHTLAATMGTATASLYVLDSEKHLYRLAAAEQDDTRGPTPQTISRDNALPITLHKGRAPLLREELAERVPSLRLGVLDAMDSLHADACFPLTSKDRLIGFFVLGTRHDGTTYSTEDLSLLTTLSQHAAIALDNALLYEDLRRSEALMRRTDRLRSLETIAGGFAHEVRNPLTSIKTFVQLVPDRRDDSEFVDQFSLVVAEDVNRIERLVQEILDYARYMEPQLTEQDLNEVVTSCLYFIEIKATARGVTITRDLGHDIPLVTMDRQQIKQVLLNLFINALDAMTERMGQLSVHTHAFLKADGTSWIQIEVSDTGSGIEPQNLEHIFDPFYTTKHNSMEREGTGLGLTMVHQIVREHRGYIDVVSEVGRGTSFYVNLPVTPDDAPRPTLTTTAPAADAPASTQAAKAAEGAQTRR